MGRTGQDRTKVSLEYTEQRMGQHRIGQFRAQGAKDRTNDQRKEEGEDES